MAPALGLTAADLNPNPKPDPNQVTGDGKSLHLGPQPNLTQPTSNRRAEHSWADCAFGENENGTQDATLTLTLTLYL